LIYQLGNPIVLLDRGLVSLGNIGTTEEVFELFGKQPSLRDILPGCGIFVAWVGCNTLIVERRDGRLLIVQKAFQNFFFSYSKI